MDLSTGTTSDDVLQIAQDLLFPEGQSNLRKVESVTLSLIDYRENCMYANATVGTIFLATKLPRLIFHVRVEKTMFADGSSNSRRADHLG